MSKYFIFIIMTVILNASAQLLVKAGMNQVGQAEFSASKITNFLISAAVNPLIIIGLIAMTASMCTNLMALSRYDVSFAFPFISIAYVIVAAWGFFVFGENMNAYRIVGILIIISGTIVLAKS